MGQSLLAVLREDAEFRLCGAVASGASTRLGQDAATDGAPIGIAITADPAQVLGEAAVAVDFSLNLGVAAHARACAAARVPLLVGATGLDAPTLAELSSASQSIAVLIAPNTSVGVAVLSRAVAEAARALGESYDVEIAEAHHRSKRDAPSGTALHLGKVVADVRERRLSDLAAFDRRGPREPGSIGFSAVRAGDIVGEHTVIFAGHGECLEMTHRATDRSTFARGALRAAAWLVGRPAGLYGMHDALGL